MGCASSAALPFLTNRGSQAVAESPRVNGKPPYELKMVNNKLRENGVANVKDVNEAYATEKMKEVADSTGVQGVIGGVIQAKDEIVSQVKGFGDALSEKVTSAVDSAEETIETAFGKLTGVVDEVKDEFKSEVASIEENVESILHPGKEKLGQLKADELDELLESLPTEEEVTEPGKRAGEEGKVAEEAAGENDGE